MLFADTFYWQALLDQRDQWHEAVLAYTSSMGAVLIVTTQEVLVEVLNALSGSRESIRRAAATYVQNISRQPHVEVIPQSPESFSAGLLLYLARPDQNYSMTDCISMCAMKARGIWEVLTGDEHFQNEGFQRLFTP